MSSKIKIADCNGDIIQVGDVLQSLIRNERGVVVEIVKEHDVVSGPCVIGDLTIQLSLGITCVSHRYSEWRKIPHNDQTYQERYDAWQYSDEEPDYDEEPGGVTRAEAVAIQGIMALLPDNIVNWDCGPWPDRLENALAFIAAHLLFLNEAINSRENIGLKSRVQSLEKINMGLRDALKTIADGEWCVDSCARELAKSVLGKAEGK